MASVPGPRTKPTVKPMVSMNNKNLNSWEVRLNIVQIVIVIGLVTGSMACAFYLGFFSGRSAGVELALQSSAANLSKMPIVDEDPEVKVSDEIISEVYAKLNENHSFDAVEENQLPQVAPIESSQDQSGLINDEAIVQDQAVFDRVDSKPSIEEEASSLANNGVEFLGGTHKKTASTTLGSLLEQSTSAVSKNPLEKAVVNKIETQPEPFESNLSKLETKKELVARVERPVGEVVVPKEKVQPIVREEENRVARLQAVEKKIQIDSSNSAEMVADEVRNSAVEENKRPANVRRYIQNKVSSGWYAQVAAPKELTDADGMANNLKGSGFSVAIEVAKVRGQEYYRVLVGPENSRVLANRLLSQVKREPYLKGEPFIKLVR